MSLITSYKIAGTIKKSNTPLNLKIRAYKRSTGIQVGYTTAISGEFEISNTISGETISGEFPFSGEYLVSGESYVVVGFDNETTTNTFNAVLLDNIKPKSFQIEQV